MMHNINNTHYFLKNKEKSYIKYYSYLFIIYIYIYYIIYQVCFDTLDNVRYSYKKLRVLSFSINLSVCLYYIDFRLFYVKILFVIFIIITTMVVLVVSQRNKAIKKIE